MFFARKIRPKIRSRKEMLTSLVSSGLGSASLLLHHFRTISWEKKWRSIQHEIIKTIGNKILSGRNINGFSSQ